MGRRIVLTPILGTPWLYDDLQVYISNPNSKELPGKVWSARPEERIVKADVVKVEGKDHNTTNHTNNTTIIAVLTSERWIILEGQSVKVYDFDGKGAEGRAVDFAVLDNGRRWIKVVEEDDGGWKVWKGEEKPEDEKDQGDNDNQDVSKSPPAIVTGYDAVLLGHIHPPPTPSTCTLSASCTACIILSASSFSVHPTFLYTPPPTSITQTALNVLSWVSSTVTLSSSTSSLQLPSIYSSPASSSITFTSLTYVPPSWICGLTTQGRVVVYEVLDTLGPLTNDVAGDVGVKMRHFIKDLRVLRYGRGGVKAGVDEKGERVWVYREVEGRVGWGKGYGDNGDGRGLEKDWKGEDQCLWTCHGVQLRGTVDAWGNNAKEGNDELPPNTSEEGESSVKLRHIALSRKRTKTFNATAIRLVEECKSVQQMGEYVRTAVGEGIEGDEIGEIVEKGRERAEGFGELERWEKEIREVECARQIMEIMNEEGVENADSDEELGGGGDGKEVEEKYRECEEYISILQGMTSTTETVGELKLKELYSTIHTATTMTNRKFVNAVYLRAVKDVFWRRNVERIVRLLNDDASSSSSDECRIRESDAVRCLFSLTSSTLPKPIPWTSLKSVLSSVILRSPTHASRVMSPVLAAVTLDVEEEGRDEVKAIMGFMASRILGEAVRETTGGMEDKSKGKIKRGGEEWKLIEMKARRRVLVGGRNVYERAAREQVEWEAKVEDIKNLEEKIRQWEKGKGIRRVQTDYVTECDWLESNWSVMWEDRRGGYKTSNRHFLTKGPKPILFYLPRFNHSPTLAIKRAIIMARDFRESPTNTTLLSLSICNLLSTPSTPSRSAVAVVIFELLRPILSLLITKDFELNMEYTEEELGDLLENKGWGNDVVQEARRIVGILQVDEELSKPEYIDDYAGGNVDFDSYDPPLDSEIVDFTYNFTLSPPDPSSLRTYAGLLAAMSVILRSDSSDLSLSLLPTLLPSNPPTIAPLFTRGCLNLPVPPSPPTEAQRDFLDIAISNSFTSTVPTSTSTPPTAIPHSTLDELTTLGSSWGINPSVVSSMYIVAMWELARDMEVEEILQAGLSTDTLDANTLVEGGIKVAARRMQNIVDGFRKEKSLKASLGMVDASMMVWVKETSKSLPPPPSPPPKPPSIQSTHQVILHLLRYEKHAELQGGEGTEEGRMERIHGLSLMSNILLSEAMKTKKTKKMG